MGRGQGEDGQSFGDVFLHPGGQLGGRLLVAAHQFAQPSLGGRSIGAGKHAADLGGNPGAVIDLGNVGLGVLLQMKLATLPGWPALSEKIWV